jgi:hypothetical protein
MALAEHRLAPEPLTLLKAYPIGPLSKVRLADALL